MSSNLQRWFEESWREEHNGRSPESHWVICPQCSGEGTSCAYLGAYTQSDREEMGEEWYDFMDDMQRGVYDRPCPDCGGTGKVKEYSGEAGEEYSNWLAEDAADRHTQWMESGCPQ